ncbi:MAG: exonuclease domain-containing protein [bacterium]
MNLARRPINLWQDKTLVAFDTETTGLWAPANRIVEIGAVRFRLEAGELDRFSTLVNPQRPMPADVIRVHGITDEMVAKAPTIDTALEAFRGFCRDDILVAHNAMFDISFVACELKRLGQAFPDNPILDTVDLYQRFRPDLGSYALLSLVKQMSLGTGQDHRALADAQYVRRLTQLLAPELGAAYSPADLGRIATVYSMSDWQQDDVVLPSGFEPLRTAIANKTRVNMRYQTPPHPPSWRVITPLGLYGLADKIYLNAFCERSDSERTFRLDRISSFEVIDQ